MLFTGSRGCRWAISIPILGRLSFPRMFLSCPEVIKKLGFVRDPSIGLSSHYHFPDDVDCVVGESAK